MAKSVNKNPTYYSGPPLEQESWLATDAKTWIAGCPVVFAAAGTVEPAASSTTTGIIGLFAEDQSASTSSTTVKIWRIKSASTRFLAYVSNDDADTTADTADVDDVFGIHVSAAGRATVNVNDTSGGVFKVDQLYQSVETGRAAAADDPGRVIGHFTQAVIDG